MHTKHPGSEPELDQQRPGGPRYHGASWTDAAESRVDGPEMEELDALPEAVHSGEHEGMGGMGHEYRRHRKNPTHEPEPAATERARHVPERP